MKKNSFSELEHLEMVARRVADNGMDLTASYGDWLNVTFACASLGEPAREAYHTICSLYPNYSREECDLKFENCLKTGDGSITLGTLLKMAQDAGIDTSLPRGRRPKSTQQTKEEQENRMQQMREALNSWAEWRFNLWRNRPEMRESGQAWRPVQDRDLDTLYCRLKESGIPVKSQDVKALIFSRDFSADYDAVKTWFDGLKEWNPDTDPDYLKDFYIGHLEFGDPENEGFYENMLKRWHVGMVELMLGSTHENPIMVILKGQQHIGKSYFARHILPPELREYLMEVGPAEPINKDLIISLSETPLILFDEISFGSDQKNDAFKFIVTSSRSNLRDAYHRFRESRERRASLIATTNEDKFLRDSEGSRRFLSIDLKDTVDLDQFPLPYEGAYAQALYLLQHGFEAKPTHDESLLITEHNKAYMEPNDCEEAILTFLKQPDGTVKPTALSAGDIMHELNYRGFHGREFNSSAVGKIMTRLGFEKKVFNGSRKYLVVLVDPDLHKRENDSDAKKFVPDIL